MSLDLTELQAVTDDYVEKRQPTDIYFTSNALLWKLMSRGNTYPGGKKIQVMLEYDALNSAAYGPTSTLNLARKDIFNAAFFQYGAYYVVITIDMDDDLQNSGDLAVVNLVQGKLGNAAKSIRKTMGGDVYALAATTTAADPKAKPLVGLADMFQGADTSVAYGEIAEDDMALWKANNSAVEFKMNFKNMQAFRRTASIDTTAEGKPDLYMTTELLQDAFERTQQVQVRYSSKELLDAGFDNVLFKGAAVVADDNQTDKYVDCLNTMYLDMLTHQKRNFTKPVWQSPIDQPDTAVANIRWAGQLVCSNRKAHARFTNVIEPD